MRSKAVTMSWATIARPLTGATFWKFASRMLNVYVSPSSDVSHEVARPSSGLSSISSPLFMLGPAL